MNKIEIFHAQADYAAWLFDYDFTQEQVTLASENPADQIELPAIWNSGKVDMVPRESPIAGLGLFAAAYINEHFILGPATIHGFRTPFGRWLNHSPSPNCRFFKGGNGGLYLVAWKEIAAGRELTVSYWQAGRVNGHPNPKPVRIGEM